MTEYVGVGEILKIKEILDIIQPEKVFLLTGKHSYTASGAQKYIEDALQDIEVLHYSDFAALPLYEDIMRGVERYKDFAPDLVIAVGGGHVLDIAKAINFLSSKKPLLAIPTTAGSGSEATQFAVIYKDGVKHSLEDAEILPTFVIVDPTLSFSVPKEIAIPSALDALAQSIESYWSKSSTEESRAYAKEALTLIWGNIVEAIEQRSEEAMTSLSIGAHLAGKAINISKTTACHALSYGLTYHHHVPHGIAVALFLPTLYCYNSKKDDSFSELNHIMGCKSSTDAAAELQTLLARFGIVGLKSWGVKESGIPFLVSQVNAKRLGNNPRRITEQDIFTFYKNAI